MEWIDTNLLISICTCAIGLIQFLFWKHIAKQKSYESEKGKNLATKEDISEITRQIKSVESVFSDKTEKLKAALNLQTNIETRLISEKRKVIAELHASLQKWRYAIVCPDLTRFDNKEMNYNNLEKIDNFYSDVLTKKAIFKIYIEDEGLRYLIDEVNEKGIECMGLAINILIHMVNFNIELEPLKACNKNEEIDTLFKENFKNGREFHIQQTEAANVLSNLIEEFEDQCRTYITEYAKSIH